MALKKIRRVFSVCVSAAVMAAVLSGTANAVPAHSPARSGGPVVVVSGLNNPRELSLVHDDVLLIAEAGEGGTVATVAGPDGSQLGLGYTGSISAVLAPSLVRNQRPHRIVTGLLSGAAATASAQGPVGSGATGPDGVSASSLNQIAITETTFGPTVPKAAQARDGQLLLSVPWGPVSARAGITAFEAKHDPDRQGVDSNPYAVLAYRGGWLVADAAANDVLQVDRRGHVSVFHVFPNIKSGACAGQFDPVKPFAGCNFVPTSLASDQWGNVYVGALGSLVPGAGEVVKLNDDGTPVKTWTGFTAVSGVAVGADGSVYVSQLFAHQAHPVNSAIQGVLTRIDGNRRTNTDVPFPAGIAVDGRNNIFVSVYSILPSAGAGIPGLDTSGQVWRLRM